MVSKKRPSGLIVKMNRTEFLLQKLLRNPLLKKVRIPRLSKKRPSGLIVKINRTEFLLKNLLRKPLLKMPYSNAFEKEA